MLIHHHLLLQLGRVICILWVRRRKAWRWVHHQQRWIGRHLIHWVKLERVSLRHLRRNLLWLILLLFVLIQKWVIFLKQLQIKMFGFLYLLFTFCPNCFGFYSNLFLLLACIFHLGLLNLTLGFLNWLVLLHYVPVRFSNTSWPSHIICWRLLNGVIYKVILATKLFHFADWVRNLRLHIRVLATCIPECIRVLTWVIVLSIQYPHICTKFIEPDLISLQDQSTNTLIFGKIALGTWLRWHF